MKRAYVNAALVIMTLSAPAIGGAELKAGQSVEVATPPAIVGEPSATVRIARRQPGQILRCWQDGRLLYEAGGFRAGADHNSTSVPVPRAVEGEPVTILDLRDGLCILSTD